MDRADGAVVDVGIRGGGGEVCRRVGRAPDDRLGSEKRPRLDRREVVLAQVDAVGAAGRDELGAVVEDEQRARGVGRLAERARGLDESGVVERLVTELDDVDATAQRRGQPVARPGVADEVEPGGVEAVGVHGPL